MIVKDLIKFLSDFNPVANVRLIANGQNEILTFGGWRSVDGDDTPTENRNVEFEKLKATEVYLHLLREDYPNGAMESTQYKAMEE